MRGEKIAFPEGFEKGTLYSVLDRHDIKQYRELYSSKESVDAVRKGQPIPSGTVLTLVQYKAQVDHRAIRSRTRTAASGRGTLSPTR